MEWPRFCTLVAGALELDTSSWRPDTTLVEAGLDSLATYELVVLLEQRTGIALPDEAIESIRTLGDAWAWGTRLADPAAVA